MKNLKINEILKIIGFIEIENINNTLLNITDNLNYFADENNNESKRKII